MTGLKGLVLIGGKSSRMGFDKSSIKFYDNDQKKHCYNLLKKFCDEVYISCKQEQTCRLPYIIDKFSNKGPVAGLLSAHSTFPESAFLVLACDMPFIDENAIRTLIQNRAANVTLFADKENRLQPLAAIWEPMALKVLKRNYLQNILSLNETIKTLDANVIHCQNKKTLKNINTQSELHSVLNSF